MRETIISEIKKYKLIAILRGLTPAEAVDTARALREGGVRMLEITFDQTRPEAFGETGDAIRAIRAAFPDLFVGAGTVLTKKQVDITAEAGGTFIISPDADREVIAYTVQKGLVSIPGAYTATEVKAAYTAGADFVKIFPCLEGAPDYIKAIRAPLAHIPLMAVGGVNADNAGAFLRAGCCGVGVGSALVNKTLIRSGAWEDLTALARRFVAAVRA